MKHHSSSFLLFSALLTMMNWDHWKVQDSHLEMAQCGTSHCPTSRQICQKFHSFIYTCTISDHGVNLLNDYICPNSRHQSYPAKIPSSTPSRADQVLYWCRRAGGYIRFWWDSGWQTRLCRGSPCQREATHLKWGMYSNYVVFSPLTYYLCRPLSLFRSLPRHQPSSCSEILKRVSHTKKATKNYCPHGYFLLCMIQKPMGASLRNSVWGAVDYIGSHS